MSRTAIAIALLCPGLAWAEGSDDTNVGNTGHDQILDARADNGNLFTTVYVDILTANEVILFNRIDGNLQLYSPSGTLIGTFTDSSAPYTAPTVGAYRIEFSQDQVDWDIAVQGAPIEQGRVWSRAWHFDAQNFQWGSRTYASFYALVEGGDATHNGVVQMRTSGMAGYLYLIAANRFGMTDANGRSVPQNSQFNVVTVEYDIYLRPPQKALYNPLTPTISGVGFDYDAACDQVAFDVTDGVFTFTSDLDGTYHIVCDLGGGPEGVPDGVFDFTDDVDLHLIGETGPGNRLITWDGTNNRGEPVPAGTYNCEAWLTIGEFHYVAGDVETSYEGFQLYRVNRTGGTTISQVPRPMYWNDELVQGNEPLMYNADPPGLMRSGPDGIEPGDYTSDPVDPGYWDVLSSGPVGNARSWGHFSTLPSCGSPPPNECSKGDYAWLDTYTWLTESDRVPFTVTVGSLADGDGDTLVDAEEECLYGTDPDLEDTDGDGLGDEVEVFDLPTDPTNPDSDGDGFDDGTEVGDDPANPESSDSDTLIDAMDPDDDNDGIPTADENDYANGDEDGTPNHLDTDSDNDGLLDSTEGNVQSDDDGVPDFLDLDSDDDTVPDATEGTTDTDSDGAADFRDDDDDNDTIPTADEVGEGNTDGDAFADYKDPDDDNDGISTQVEHSYADGDTDGTPNHQDLDSDDDGLLDEVEGAVQSDDDDNPDFVDTDSDNDSLLDGAEGTTDTDGDSKEDFRDPDDDEDTIPTIDEAGRGDTDGDNTVDHLDEDDDDDGILTKDEAADGAEHGDDVDSDGDNNWVDTDSDGDGVGDGLGSDEEERVDTDEDGVPDYLDPDGAYLFDYSGSCMLSSSTGGAPVGALAGLLAILAAAAVRRRRVGVVLAALLVAGVAHAGDAPEISRSTGRPGQVVVLWPRVVPSAASDEVLLLAGALQDRIVLAVQEGAPELTRNVRPEPERVCPKQGGCKAPSVGALLAHHEGGCVVVGWVSEPGKSPAQLVPLAGRMDLKASESPFREPPETLVTVRDFAECASVVQALDPDGIAALQAMLHDAE